LFGAAKVYILFVLSPLLLVFEDLAHHYHVYQLGELGLYVGELHSVDYLLSGENDAILARVVFTGSHNVGHFVLFTVVTEVVVLKFNFGSGTAANGLNLQICGYKGLFVGDLFLLLWL
jgi:hypothetical protein